MVELASAENTQTPPFAHHSTEPPLLVPPPLLLSVLPLLTPGGREQGTTGVWHLEP